MDPHPKSVQHIDHLWCAPILGGSVIRDVPSLTPPPPPTLFVNTIILETPHFWNQFSKLNSCPMIC